MQLSDKNYAANIEKKIQISVSFTGLIIKIKKMDFGEVLTGSKCPAFFVPLNTK